MLSSGERICGILSARASLFTMFSDVTLFELGHDSGFEQGDQIWDHELEFVG